VFPEFGAVIARSEATKPSQGGGTRAHEREIAAPSPPSAWSMARNDRSREMRGSRAFDVSLKRVAGLAFALLTLRFRRQQGWSV
jgi:hypothetical protein